MKAHIGIGQWPASILGILLLTWLGGAAWRQATEKELTALIPARAPVVTERIETELRTAAGVTDGRGQFIFGVVIITAGYSAEGKYSHFFQTQVPLKIGEFALAPGEYVIGYRRRDAESLEVSFYEAATGHPRGQVAAYLSKRNGPIRSFLITPPTDNKGYIQFGRFGFEYWLG